MVVRLARIIAVALVIFAVAFLAIVPATASAMDMSAGDCGSVEIHTGLTIPSCCLAAGCPISGGGSSNPADSGVLIPSRPDHDGNSQYCLLTTNVSTGLDCQSTNQSASENLQVASSYSNSEYRCRNSLGSEESDLI